MTVDREKYEYIRINTDLSDLFSGAFVYSRDMLQEVEVDTLLGEECTAAVTSILADVNRALGMIFPGSSSDAFIRHRSFPS